MENKIKSKVLQQIIDLMGNLEAKDLKSKSPKFMQIKTNDPEMAEDVIESAMNKEENLPMKDSSMKDHNMEEDMDESQMMSPKPESEDEEDLKKLMELREKLK